MLEIGPEILILPSNSYLKHSNKSWHKFKTISCSSHMCKPHIINSHPEKYILFFYLKVYSAQE